MSSLIFHTDENQVFVATDTLAVSPDGRPFKFTTKAFIVPHLRIIIAGTGAGGFLGGWFVRINDWLVVQGIDDLNNRAPNDLAAMWPGFKKEFSFPDSTTVTVYHFGFSENTGLIHSFAYRSTNNFQSEKLRYDAGAKPKCTIPANYRFPEDIRKMMDEQRTAQASLPEGERLYIGGEIQIHHLTSEGFHVYTLDRFDDYDRDEQSIYRRFHQD